jgi:V8-like Glu-specific endopeptidase
MGKFGLVGLLLTTGACLAQGDETYDDSSMNELENGEKGTEEACSAPATPVDTNAPGLMFSPRAMNGLERVKSKVKVASPCAAAKHSPDDDVRRPAADIARLRGEDKAWRASDGSRFEAMLVMPDGTAYGRRGASRKAKAPSEANEFGSFEGDRPSDEEIALAIEKLEQTETDDGLNDKGILGSSLSTDRRARISSTGTLTGFPMRTIGALNQSQSAGETGCTGTKVGPRHVLTAAHCVLASNGTWTTSGWFHPGQTRTAHPNTGGTAVRWSGVYARDWRVDSRWDYALLYLEDRRDSFQLGWLGVAWWTNSAGYNGKNVSVHGYPMRSSSSNAEKCNASSLSNKDCGGWMYGHSDTLDSAAFRSDEQLEYDIDTTRAQSGSSVRYNLGGSNWVTLGVHYGCAGFGGCGGGRNRAARFRQNMWNDICGWIAEVPSTHGQHSLCN